MIYGSLYGNFLVTLDNNPKLERTKYPEIGFYGSFSIP